MSTDQFPTEQTPAATTSEPDLATQLRATKKQLRATNGQLAYWKARSLRSERERNAISNIRGQGYAERNRLVAFLARLYPGSHLVAPDPDAYPEPANGRPRVVRPIACIHFPDGRNATFHFSPEEESFFAGLEYAPADWDGHTTDEKFAMIDQLGQQLLAERLGS